MKNFKVTSTVTGQYLGSVRAKDQASALKTAAALYGNFFSADKGIRVE